jgi:hypothetical protein
MRPHIFVHFYAAFTKFIKNGDFVPYGSGGWKSKIRDL